MKAKTSSAAIAAILAATPAALAWEHSMQRGLDLYQTASDSMALSLVCDPDNVYGGASASALLVQAGGETEYTGPVRISFPDEITIETTATYGQIGKGFVAAELWQALLAGLRENTTFTVTVGSIEHEIDTGAPADFSCQ